MLIYTGEDVIYNNKDTKRYDGIYYAIIIRSFKTDDGLNSLCYVYIPEIFPEGWKQSLYYRCYDYPRVEVPNSFDNCETGDQTPRTGQIIKVSFDDGDIRSCRYLMSIPTNSFIEAINRNFITDGTLPSDITSVIEDENILTTFRLLLPVANYITTGYENPPAEKYKYKYVLSNINSSKNELGVFKNWFIEALTMPLQSYSNNNLVKSYNIPYYSTNIYSLVAVLQNVINTKYGQERLAKLYDNIPNDNEYIKFNINKTKLTNIYDKAKAASIWILGLITGQDNEFNEIDPENNESDKKANLSLALANIAFSDAVKDHVSPTLNLQISDNTTNPAELLWFIFSYGSEENFWSKQSISAQVSRPHRIFADEVIKVSYEKHWLSVIATWATAINNITTDNSMRNIILMCLTIAPWFASPLLLYQTANSETVKAMRSFINSYKKYSDIEDIYIKYIICLDNIDNMDYSSVFPNEETYVDFSNTLQKLIKENNKTDFIDKFKEYTIKFLGQGKAESFYSEAFAKNDFESKFERLKERMLN